MRPKETREVVDMIKRIENGGGGGGGETNIEILKLNTALEGTYPIEVTVEDEEDIEKLNAIMNSFVQSQQMPPLFFERAAFNSSEDAFVSVAPLAEIDLNNGVFMLSYVCCTNQYMPIDYYTIAFGENEWHIVVANHEE